MTDGATAAVREAELERCRATGEHDWATLGAVLSDDFVYTHMNGQVDDKDDYLDGLRNVPRTIRRGDLRIRIYGDIALMNGRQYLDAGTGEVEGEVLEVWHRVGDGWQLVACQSTRVG
jgi:hypothetical protein